MHHSASLASLSPAVIVHLVFALGALVFGPFALRVRKGTPAHRACGYAWVTLMLGAAITSLFIRDFRMPNLGGYTPIHMVTLATLAGVTRALYLVIVRRNIVGHRKLMQQTYLGACIIAGGLALLPGRYLGDLVWRDALGLG
jgi:uncharacterized membrane protein